MAENNEVLVLNKGLIRLVSFMGGDAAVVQAARVSFGKGVTNDARDKKLLFYLMANRHETPFEHSVFKFHIKCPLFVARQWFRHRMASYNEISGRYAQMKEEFFVPERLRTQKASNYKYDLVAEDENKELLLKIDNCFQQSFDLYKELLEKGVAKEHARMVLPLALYTQFYWTVNARSLMNFISLRIEEHAQYEIQEYARALASIFKEKMPWTYESFENYILQGKKWTDS